eukprot:3037-Heterococcus_DN1.PRE.4
MQHIMYSHALYEVAKQYAHILHFATISSIASGTQLHIERPANTAIMADQQLIANNHRLAGASTRERACYTEDTDGAAATAESVVLVWPMVTQAANRHYA